MKNILIVDDSATSRLIMRRCLRICGLDGVEFTEASNGNEALSILKEVPVDMVFTDLNMPEMDGEQLLKRMKSSPKLFNIPVVIISSTANTQKEKKLLEDNAAKVFSKPISLPELREYLETIAQNE